MRIGYIRVSSKEQNTIRQEEIAKEYNVDKVYIDKMSGKDTNRPQLKEMLNYVRSEDVVIVAEISRLARNTKDLLDIVEQFNDKGVRFISIKEGIDTDNACSKFLISVFGAMAELERDYIRERQAQGIAIAKENGVYKGRKPLDLGDDFISAVNDWKAKKRTAVSVMKEFNISAPTFYDKVKKIGDVK